MKQTVKMRFMQNAPKFVIAVGFGSLAVFALAGLVVCFTDEWKFGIYVTLLCISAIGFLIWAMRKFERICKTSISDAMARDKKSWGG